MSGKIILVTGLSGAGKTHYANSLGLPTIRYDSVHNYAAGKTDYEYIREWVLKNKDSKEIVIDAWGFYFDPDLTILQELVGSREIEIRFLYMTPLQLHLSQLQKEADGKIHLSRNQAGFLNHITQLRNEMSAFAASFLVPLQLQDFAMWWICRKDYQIRSYEDNKHFLETTVKDPTKELLEWVDKVSGDPKYQTLEIDGKIIRHGYMHSNKLWQQIEGFNIDWQNKDVVDLGCFNGYFSFKAEEAGARTVNGYDVDKRSHIIAEKMRLLKKSKCEFFITNLALNPERIRPEKPHIALLLNSLHHIIKGSDDGGYKFLTHICCACDEIIVSVNSEHLILFQEIAADHDFRLVAQENTHPKTGQKARQLYHFKKEQK